MVVRIWKTSELRKGIRWCVFCTSGSFLFEILFSRFLSIPLVKNKLNVLFILRVWPNLIPVEKTFFCMFCVFLCECVWRKNILYKFTFFVIINNCGNILCNLSPENVFIESINNGCKIFQEFFLIKITKVNWTNGNWFSVPNLLRSLLMD